MSKKVILSVYHSKNPFNSLLMCEGSESFYLAKIKNTRRALRKIKKKLPDTDILIVKGSESEKIFRGNVRKYEGYTCRTLLPVLEKICRQTINKYKLSLPLEEIYIMAGPQIACAMVLSLVNISKVFTVVSSQAQFMNLYDEIYFKHGTIIRHLPEFNASIAENSLIIRCTDEKFPLWSKTPVIDMCAKPEISDLTLALKNISISDENIESIGNEWKGVSGIELYELFGLIPSEKAVVNINKKADEIFLLDTERF